MASVPVPSVLTRNVVQHLIFYIEAMKEENTCNRRESYWDKKKTIFFENNLPIILDFALSLQLIVQHNSLFVDSEALAKSIATTIQSWES